MNDLTDLSLRLKDPSIGKDKSSYLFKQLQNFNLWIKERVRAEAQKV